ncbi:MAG: alpha/beta hydrolase [Clostridia bacterium]|nr:alpha/beta hydrolase [Clostridia bacterium]
MLKIKNAFMIIAFLCLTFLFSGCSKPAVPTSISVDSSNAKYWYVSGTEIDPSGLVIHASMTDGTTKEIPVSECSFEKPAFAPYGEKEVTVHYGDLSAVYPIYSCPSAAETDSYTTYTVRLNENGSRVTLTASLVGENKPFVLIFPGGGYAAVYMRQEGFDYAAEINRLGFNAFILEYSVNMEHPAPLNDVNTAYEIIEQNKDFFHVTMDNYAVCGSSAGGHLAATWSTNIVGAAHYEKPRPAAVILAYASTHIFEDSRSNLVGENASDERKHSLSADENVDFAFPPTYNWVFVEDTEVAKHTRLMEAALENAGVPHITRYFVGGKHGLGLAEKTEAFGWMEEAITFWQEHLTSH